MIAYEDLTWNCKSATPRPPLGAVPARVSGGGATLSSRAAEGAFGHHMARVAPLPPPAEHRSGCRTAIAFPCCRLAHGAGRNHMPRLGHPNGHGNRKHYGTSLQHVSSSLCGENFTLQSSKVSWQ